MNWESKAIVGALVDRKTSAQITTAKRTWPDSQRRRGIANALDAARQAYVKELNSLLDDPESNALPGARALMLSNFEAVARMGCGLAGLPQRRLSDKELINLGRMVDFEFGRFAAFHKQENEARSDRVKLYGGGMDASFWKGWLGSLPAGSMVQWKLGVADHCAKCPLLAAKGPYSLPGSGANPLPTVPKLGDTPCLGNCKCELLAHGPDFVSQLVGVPMIEVTAIMTAAAPGSFTDVTPNSPESRAAEALYVDSTRSYVFDLRMGVVDPTVNWMGRAIEVQRQYESMAANLGHLVRMTQSMAEIRTPVIDAIGAGMKFVRPQDAGDDLIGLIALVLALDSTKRGKVQAVERGRIKLEHFGWVPYGEGAQSLLFVDPASKP